ncbi:tetratricopeptide repeat protein [Arenimonas sp.]|uniref:tetratricopeptide repeat protein n=1 Tax=Arenimonas sp. TaxID=1872635 RepID=UPI0035ADF40D
MFARVAVLGLALTLAACASAPAGPSSSAGAAAGKAARVSPAGLVAQVRAAGEQGHELEVQPLRDPQVEDLRAQAQAQEAAGKPRAAFETLDRALAISPDDPDLLQWQAELALLRRAWEQAETLAARSFAVGPKLGGLCRRNWATIGHARTMRGADEAAATAHRQGESCTVAPPVRM